jgi:hypothetical protein
VKRVYQGLSLSERLGDLVGYEWLLVGIGAVKELTEAQCRKHRIELSAG